MTKSYAEIFFSKGYDSKGDALKARHKRKVNYLGEPIKVKVKIERPSS